MSSLFVYHVSNPELPHKVLNHLEDIAATLAEHGVIFERLAVDTGVTAGVSDDELIKACQATLARLKSERGLGGQAIIRLDSRQPSASQAPARLNEEHVYGADQVRWIIAGRGQFYLHVGDCVYAVICEKNDLLTVPAGTAQWFEAGDNPYLLAISLSKGGQGSEPGFITPNSANHYPPLEY